jgi:enoyl-CoA hydratase
MPSIDYKRIDGIAIIQLNKPERLNALSAEMIRELKSLFGQLEGDLELRAVVLTGAGYRAFCAGTDIGELNGADEAQARAISENGQRLCRQIENSPVPVIAAINGIAAGGGLELALACHLRLASSHSSFSMPETQLGLVPAYGGTQRLVREVGAGRALGMMLTGKTITSEQALEFGLVNCLVPPADLLSEAVAVARKVEELSPLSIRACLKAVIQGLELTLEEGFELETKLFASLFATADAKEGTSAFLEKRKPVFRGR